MKKDSQADAVDTTSDSRNIAKNPNAVALGRIGGAAGTGDSKRRSKEHYQKASAARWAKHRESKKQ
jgi:hypothetical protein